MILVVKNLNHQEKYGVVKLVSGVYIKVNEGFDLNIRSLNPKFVSIGADSKNHNLPEPSKKEIERLISRLNGFGIEIKLKNNLKRIFDG